MLWQIHDGGEEDAGLVVARLGQGFHRHVDAVLVIPDGSRRQGDVVLAGQLQGLKNGGIGDFCNVLAVF